MIEGESITFYLLKKAFCMLAVRILWSIGAQKVSTILLLFNFSISCLILCSCHSICKSV